jgi:hypothetical protein
MVEKFVVIAAAEIKLLLPVGLKEPEKKSHKLDLHREVGAPCLADPEIDASASTAAQ